jgi:hypothetical protein
VINVVFPTKPKLPEWIPEGLDDVDPFVLDPNDPFEAVLIEMVTTNRAKRKDYAVDGNPFSNFYGSAEIMRLAGVDPFNELDSAVFNIAQKLVRRGSLKVNGREEEPENEPLEDTYRDLAVYAAILYAMYLYPDGQVI